MRPTKAIVTLGALATNFKAASKRAPDSRNVAVIKANAYGHGAVEVARALQPMAGALAVAFVDEAVQLREAGIESPILILGGTTCSEDVAEAAAQNFWLMLHDREQLDRFLSTRTAVPVSAWLKVDTGMHRLGMDPGELDSAVDALSVSGNGRHPVVLCTHFACAEDLASPVTKQQICEFGAVAAKWELPMSLANSAGIMYWPESHADWNRPGYMLYGNNPTGSTDAASDGLTPAMTMTSEVIAIKHVSAGESVGYGHTWTASVPSRIGTIAIGYGDGYPRHAANGTPVLVNGRRAPLAGTVSMDMITVDLTDFDSVKPGDPVELWGENISVNEVASCAGTIGYDLLAGLTGRVPIIHLP